MLEIKDIIHDNDDYFTLKVKYHLSAEGDLPVKCLKTNGNFYTLWCGYVFSINAAITKGIQVVGWTKHMSIPNHLEIITDPLTGDKILKIKAAPGPRSGVVNKTQKYLSPFTGKWV